MNVLTVVSHPRLQSLTFAVADKFTQGLVDAGHKTEIVDFHRNGFSPVLLEPDEPDWSSDQKIYSPEVKIEMERMRKHAALAYIFPYGGAICQQCLRGILIEYGIRALRMAPISCTIGKFYGSVLQPIRKKAWQKDNMIR